MPNLKMSFTHFCLRLYSHRVLLYTRQFFTYFFIDANRRLVIFSMSGNNTLEADFADPRFSFKAVRVHFPLP